jgi:hypothetical protein
VSGELLIDAVRAGWLTLAFMMLLSRVVFQAKGAEWMRGFLDGWQRGGVKRLWGVAALAFAGFLVAGAPSAAGELGTVDAVLLVALLGAGGRRRGQRAAQRLHDVQGPGAGGTARSPPGSSRCRSPWPWC